jgi:uncharacterized protein (DUF2236 family)
MSLEIEYRNGQRRFRFVTRPLLSRPAEDSMFEADSVIRRVFSDTALFGAGRALLLQLAHPQVARGVHDHSDYAGAPFDRLFGTFHAMSNIVYGSRRQVEAIRVGVHKAHTRVKGPGYEALDPELLQWVNATLCDAAVMMYQDLVAPLSAAELDAFYSDARHVAEVFGCPVDMQPATSAEFDAYWEATLDTLQVGEAGREVAWSLLTGTGMPVQSVWRMPMWAARALTAATLPPRIRDEFGLEWGPAQKSTAAAILAAARSVESRLPDRWRQLGAALLRSPEPSDASGAPEAAAHTTV